MDKDLHKRDALLLMLRPNVIKAMKIEKGDVGKIFVLNVGKTEAKIMTREEFLVLSVSSIGGWREVDTFDVNT